MVQLFYLLGTRAIFPLIWLFNGLRYDKLIFTWSMIVKMKVEKAVFTVSYKEDEILDLVPLCPWTPSPSREQISYIYKLPFIIKIYYWPLFHQFYHSTHLQNSGCLPEPNLGISGPLWWWGMTQRSKKEETKPLWSSPCFITSVKMKSESVKQSFSCMRYQLRGIIKISGPILQWRVTPNSPAW